MTGVMSGVSHVCFAEPVRKRSVRVVLTWSGEGGAWSRKVAMVMKRCESFALADQVVFLPDPQLVIWQVGGVLSSWFLTRDTYRKSPLCDSYARLYE